MWPILSFSPENSSTVHAQEKTGLPGLFGISLKHLRKIVPLRFSSLSFSCHWKKSIPKRTIRGTEPAITLTRRKNRHGGREGLIPSFPSPLEEVSVGSLEVRSSPVDLREGALSMLHLIVVKTKSFLACSLRELSESSLQEYRSVFVLPMILLSYTQIVLCFTASRFITRY